ncbi:TolC family protein [Bdellovibrio sp.]|uniref:TolC family protein n=1 Tax=Bdellovibrio sp. TaxID=28201 RepID=UPI0039E48289
MSKIAQWTSFVFLQLMIFGLSAQAEQVSFGKVWNSISQTSPGLKAAELQSQAAVEAKDRAGRHWLPRLYLDARSYQTNAPGQSFFGLLEQRSLRQTDFNPDAINNPDSEVFTRGSLGVDLPLYEGGMKSAQVSLQNHLSQSQDHEAAGVRVEQYSEVAKAYGSLGLLEQQKQKLLNLKQIIDRLLKSYQIGVKSNPVGYSGLLGLKSLSNRVQGLLVQYEAQSRAYYVALKEMGYTENQWSPQAEETIVFVEKYLASHSEEASFQVESLKEKSMVAQEASKMEKARFLPRVGAFAESYIFNGSRDTANGYTAGLYLQWSLFNPSDYGTHKEAQIKSLAAQKYTEAMEQKERAEKLSLDQAIQALKANIRLLEDSQKILIEQSQVAESLFKNGSINALQFVEVLNRRVDLVTSQADAGMNLLQAASQKVLKARFELPQELSQGK